MEAREISCLSEYLEAIEKLKEEYRPGIFSNPVFPAFVFRGLPKSSYSLIPKLFRKQRDKVGDKPPIENYTYLSWGDERSILLSFIHEASSCLDIPPQNLGHWAEYAQHYGVPTRFLDWSSNPLSALYFSCRDSLECDGTVWLLNVMSYRRFLGKGIEVESTKTIREIISELIDGQPRIQFPILYTPYYVDPRMSAQGSFFMVWGTEILPLENLLQGEQYYMRYPSEQNAIHTYGEEQETAILFKFTVRSHNKQKLFRELGMAGVNEKALFPGLDGIGRYVERKYRFNYGEAVDSIL